MIRAIVRRSRSGMDDGASFDWRRFVPVTWTMMMILMASFTGPGRHTPTAEAAAPGALVDTGSNLLINAGFENAPSDELPAGWEVFNPAAVPGENIFLEPGKGYTGDRALTLYDMSTSTSVGVRSTPVPAVVGATYRASVMVLAEGDAAPTLYIEFLDDDNTRVGVAFVPADGSGWQSLSTELAAPEGATQVSVILYLGRRATGVAYFDDAVLVAEP